MRFIRRIQNKSKKHKQNLVTVVAKIYCYTTVLDHRGTSQRKLSHLSHSI